MPAVKSNRPVVLPLSLVVEVNSKNPVAMTSITHRVSGVVLFLMIPVLLWVFQHSLATPEGFAHIFDNILVRLLVWVLAAATGYHFVMGIKHLLADMGMNEELKSGRTAAIVGFVIALLWVLASFVWIVL
ncbi:succinate dehydrogenase, cytochrome b556 subunit [Moraxella atlantae]|uniref:Succinate dehydrogenase cytochrome b556 subunit n=1 Tax=Faucicola atlantae TaxID=34059 RepID=A0A1B8QB59_9GAMM|nr:succinate dehydrogenase, cytochrome b556 subunit [Moraxella atlantae]OBX75403.1 succinate dehydrogenase, cytochrome b556 subunit [Moraxella atlantae]OBX76747.1 succinate dehydrogenase, cytochrome b556 subunit [Moraxella atlantae]OPH36442.1 succinate dehydrogenase, cytochrome b556 subunit [Moraxella atlantae]